MAAPTRENEAIFVRFERLIELIIGDLQAGPQPNHWLTWMQRVLDYTQDRDAAGPRLFLKAHGGMGSFDDWGPITKAGYEADREAIEVAARLLRRGHIFDSGANGEAHRD